MAPTRCAKHPQYKALRKPTADCRACRQMFLRAEAGRLIDDALAGSQKLEARIMRAATTAGPVDTKLVLDIKALRKAQPELFRPGTIRRMPKRVTRDTVPVTITLPMRAAEALYCGRGLKDTGKQARDCQKARLTLWDAICDALTDAGYPHPWEGDVA